METRIEKSKKKRIIKYTVFSLTALLICIIGINVYKNVAISSDSINVVENKPENIQNKPLDRSITISSLGNIIFHDKQIKGAEKDGGYDFTPSFRFVKDKISSADMGIGVVETTFLGYSFSGFPNFVSPDEALYAVKDAGVDVINYANNHILDSGTQGVKRSVEITKEAQLDYIGVRETLDDDKYTIKEVDGHKIGLLSYVFETPKQYGGRAINSIPIPYDLKGLINTVNYGELESFYGDVQSNIDLMKNNGVEFIILQVHWGEEYDTFPSNIQKQMATRLSELNVDIILGGHPHVIQPYETITNSNGKKVFVSYSQGNFLSNQNYEELGDARTEDGTIINFTLDVNEEEKLYLKSYEIVPTWVHRSVNENGTYSHSIIPVEEALEDLEKFNISENERYRLERSLNSTKTILGIDGFELKDF